MKLYYLFLKFMRVRTLKTNPKLSSNTFFACLSTSGKRLKVKISIKFDKSSFLILRTEKMPTGFSLAFLKFLGVIFK